MSTQTATLNVRELYDKLVTGGIFEINFPNQVDYLNFKSRLQSYRSKQRAEFKVAGLELSGTGLDLYLNFTVLKAADDLGMISARIELTREPPKEARTYEVVYRNSGAENNA